MWRRGSLNGGKGGKGGRGGGGGVRSWKHLAVIVNIRRGVSWGKGRRQGGRGGGAVKWVGPG